MLVFQLNLILTKTIKCLCNTHNWTGYPLNWLSQSVVTFKGHTLALLCNWSECEDGRSRSCVIFLSSLLSSMWVSVTLIALFPRRL